MRSSDSLHTALRNAVSAAAFALFCVYAVASHFFPERPLYATLPLAVSLAFALLLAVRGWSRAPVACACAAGIWMVWHYDPAWLVYAPPALLQALVGTLFLTSLRTERPLITRIVELVHGEPRPEFRLYTIRLTIVWGVMLLGMAIVSTLLAVFAPHEWWSLFANVLSYVLLGGLFVADYLFRRWRYPGSDQAGPLRVAAALRRHGFFRVAKKGEES